MAKPKGGMNLDQHEALGKRFKKEWVPDFSKLVLDLSRAFPRTHPINVRATALDKALNKLRSALDDDVCRQDPRQDAVRYYYGKNEPSPVRP